MNLSDTKKRIDMNEYSFQEYARYFFQFHEKILCIETIKETIEVKGSGEEPTAYYLGMKVALFDVTDVANPIEMSKITIGESFRIARAIVIR